MYSLVALLPTLAKNHDRLWGTPLDLYKNDPGEGGYGWSTNELGIWLGVSYIHSADVVWRFLAKHDMD